MGVDIILVPFHLFQAPSDAKDTEEVEVSVIVPDNTAKADVKVPQLRQICGMYCGHVQLFVILSCED